MEPALASPRYYAVEEYFALEEVSEVRHLFYRGEAFAMSGAVGMHTIVKQNCVVSLRLALRGRGCRVYDENVRLAVLEGELYMYPDVMVTCHPDDSPNKVMMRHPVVLIEVLSPGTESHDRVWKFSRYTQLASLQHYLLVSASSWLVEWYRREPSGVWSFTPLASQEDVVTILELGITLPLADIYTELDIQPELDKPRTLQ
ncbi:Uma2 family endonuclease [Hymenobacter weizhouensis]|uniref:Uma2 family endonuclease n=1 Tax=Hymenobacter sp. YIM 151500-1 TaxID=2987689 RepID=UPI0022266E8E|nr:Uma2 family endonuclease [Hymenobacter sp. YIM 151500-1]UYZ61620.1 Uma2 family endonuclease [Hymenobacter sp. YIM 151500-1]